MTEDVEEGCHFSKGKRRVGVSGDSYRLPDDLE